MQLRKPFSGKSEKNTTIEVASADCVSDGLRKPSLSLDRLPGELPTSLHSCKQVSPDRPLLKPSTPKSSRDFGGTSVWNSPASLCGHFDTLNFTQNSGLRRSSTPPHQHFAHHTRAHTPRALRFELHTPNYRWPVYRHINFYPDSQPLDCREAHLLQVCISLYEMRVSHIPQLPGFNFGSLQHSTAVVCKLMDREKSAGKVKEALKNQNPKGKGHGTFCAEAYQVIRTKRLVTVKHFSMLHTQRKKTYSKSISTQAHAESLSNTGSSHYIRQALLKFPR